MSPFFDFIQVGANHSTVPARLMIYQKDWVIVMQEKFHEEDNRICFDAPVSGPSDPNGHIYRAKQPEKPGNLPRQFIANLFEWLDIVIASVIAVVLIFTFVFRIAAIDGDSMKNTLFEDERVIITNLFYEPKPGDIVVVSRNTDNTAVKEQAEKPIIKRVIATAGQTVDIDFVAGTVTVDGVVLQEPYIREPTHRQFDIEFPVRVPENCIFVMGDNRNESLDSRSSQIGDSGMIDKKYVLGHAIFRVFPFNRIGRLA